MSSWMVLLSKPTDSQKPHKMEQPSSYTPDMEDELEARRRYRRRTKYLLDEAKASLEDTPSSVLETPDQVAQLNRKISQLTERMDEVESKGEAFAFAKDGAIVGDDLLHKLPGICRKAVKIIKNPPDTWKQYMKNDDATSIYKMEIAELKKAMEKGEGSVDKEVMHVLAALLYRILSEEE